MVSGKIELEGFSSYKTLENGFFPFVFFNGWRVAVLNYFDIVEKELLYRLERHSQTDEVFVLLNGEAWLIGAGEEAEPKEPKTFRMEQGAVYNIRQNIWHHVILSRDASVLIVENADTGEENSEYAELSKQDIERLKSEIQLVQEGEKTNG